MHLTRLVDIELKPLDATDLVIGPTDPAALTDRAAPRSRTATATRHPAWFGGVATFSSSRSNAGGVDVGPRRSNR